LKLLKRTPILLNLLVFLTLSLLYLHVTSSLHEQRSALDFPHFLEMVKGNKLLMGFYIAAMFTTFFARKSSKIFILMYFSFVFGQTSYFFLMSFDKLILLLNFTYLLFSFGFYLMWKLELDEAYYLPGFRLDELKVVPDHELPVYVTSIKLGQQFQGHLMNWNEKGCYVILDSGYSDIRGDVEIEVYYLDKTFKSAARVITKYGQGIGLEFKPEALEDNFTALNWKSFYDIIEDRGYKNRTLQRIL
jgi:hypothetical protein